MRIHIIALAGMLMLPQVHATDQLIKLPKPDELGGASRQSMTAAPGMAAGTKVDKPPLAVAVTPADSGQDAAQPTAGIVVRGNNIATAAAGKPADMSARVGGDNEDQDMQQLAERITARLAALRKAKAAALALPPVQKAASAARKSSHPVASAIHAGVHWRYEGEAGPSHWGKLNPAWGKCATGTRQSPIDIRDGIQLDLEPVAFDYQHAVLTVIDNGHTVQVNVGAGSTIAVGGHHYALSEFHFHLPSEERINGKSYPMVMHLVHKNRDGRLAVVAVLIQDGSLHQTVQQVWNNLPLEKNMPVTVPARMDVMQLLPASRDYYTYMGSRTTPPCTEGVLWIVLKQPIQLSSQQIAIFSRLYPMNARPIQSLHGRLIKESS